MRFIFVGTTVILIQDGDVFNCFCIYFFNVLQDNDILKNHNTYQ